MITSDIRQFKALLSKELKEALRDERAILPDVSTMMFGLTIYSVEGVMS